MKLSRYVAAASLALAAVGTATVAQAGGNVHFSVAVPGVAVGVSNAPVYYPQSVYAPYYVAPAPVYYAPPPVVYVPAAPVYYGAAPVYYNRPHWNHHNHRGHNGHHRHWK